MTPSINKWLRSNPVNGKYGAPLGDFSYNAESTEFPLYLQKVRLDTGGYDPSGTYWGTPDNLWCAFNGEDIGDFAACSELRLYTRAQHRDAAKNQLLADYPHLTFRR